MTENISYVVSALKYFFSKKNLRLEDEFEVLMDKPTIIKVNQLQDKNDSLRVVFDYNLQLE